jgi:two-component system chemotaxis response regulator CheB
MAIVQDPQEALYPSMPQSAIEHVDVDHVLPVSDIARHLTLAVRAPRPVVAPAPDPTLLLEVGMAELERDALAGDDRPGEPSPYSCPDCGGVLWEIADGEEYLRYRCRVGHAFSPESMLSAQSEVLEEALWSAAKTLEESARLSRRLAATERARGHDWLALRFEEKEKEARDRVEVIRRYLLETDTSEIPVAAEPGKRSATPK